MVHFVLRELVKIDFIDLIDPNIILALILWDSHKDIKDRKKDTSRSPEET